MRFVSFRAPAVMIVWGFRPFFRPISPRSACSAASNGNANPNYILVSARSARNAVAFTAWSSLNR